MIATKRTNPLSHYPGNSVVVFPLNIHTECFILTIKVIDNSK